MSKRKEKAQPAKPKRRPLDDGAFADFCLHIGMGKSLRSWAEQTRHDHAVVVRWVQNDPERTKLYREARRMQADAHIDELIDLADEDVPTDIEGRMDSAAVNNKRLRIDARKWIAAKFHPAMYGDKVDVSASVNLAALPPDQILERIAAVFAQHGMRIVTAPADDTATEPQDQP